MVGRARRAPKGAFPIKTAEDARPARIFSIERSSRSSKTRLDTWEFSLGYVFDPGRGGGALMFVKLIGEAYQFNCKLNS